MLAGRNIRQVSPAPQITLCHQHLVRQLTGPSRARVLGPYVLVCIQLHNLYMFGVCVCASSVCGDSCSLNSIIVSNWGLWSQCSVEEGILSCLSTGHTFSLQMFRSQRGKSVLGVQQQFALNTWGTRAGFGNTGQWLVFDLAFFFKTKR